MTKTKYRVIAWQADKNDCKSVVDIREFTSTMTNSGTRHRIGLRIMDLLDVKNVSYVQIEILQPPKEAPHHVPGEESGMFTGATIQAICAVAETCAQGMELEYASDAMVVAETVLDADRLSTFGFPDAHKEVSELMNQYGWDVVLKEVAKFVPTA